MASDPGAGPDSADRVPEAAIGFPDGPAVDVREVDEKSWSVLRSFEYQAEQERFTVSEGQRTDFASVPRVFVWFIPTYGRYTKAAILHDHLCELAGSGDFDRRDADGVFRQAMRVLGVPFLRRWIMWAAVRWGALTTPEGRRGWLRDAPRVVPISLLVLPVLAPAAVLVALTLLVWFVLEMIVWAPLEVTARSQRGRRRAAKRVNRPTPSF
jgi:Protein of unknown function (DUF1353)